VRRIGDQAVVGGTEISPDGWFMALTKNAADGRGVYVYEIATGKIQRQAFRVAFTFKPGQPRSST
jgi:hypothetical protein